MNLSKREVWQGKSDVVSDSDKRREAKGKAFWSISERYSFGPRFECLLLNVREQSDFSVSQDLQSSVVEDLRCNREFPRSNPLANQNLKQLLGIHKNLGILYPHAHLDKDNAHLKYIWFHVDRDVFSGKSAIEFICECPPEVGPRLALVRRFLDIQRTAF